MDTTIKDWVDQPEDSELDLNASEDKSETQQNYKMMCTSNTNRPGHFFKNLFRKDQKPLTTSEKLGGSPQEEDKLSKKEEGQLDCGVGKNLLKQKAHSISDRVNQSEDSEVERNVSEMSFSEMHTWNTARTRGFSCPTKGSEEDQKPTESKSALTVEEPSPNDDQNGPDTYLQRDDFNKFDQEDKDMNAKTKTNQREKRSINPFTFLKEELLKVFKDKDADLEPEGCLVIQTQNDVNIKEDNVNISSSTDRDISDDSKTSWTAEKSNDNLNLLKGDASNVAVIDGLKEKEVKEDCSKITDLKAETTNEPFQNGLKVDDGQEVKNMLSERKDEHLDCAFRGNSEENFEEEINADKMNLIKERKDQPEDCGLRVAVLKEKSEKTFTEIRQSDENVCSSNTSRPGGFFKNLFRRDQNTLRTSDNKDKPQVIITVPEKTDKQEDSGGKGIFSEQNEDKNIKDRMSQPEEKSERTPFSETKQSEEMMSMSNTRGPTGIPCSAPGSGDQKPRKSKSALTVGETSQENNHRESETCLQEDVLAHKLDQKGHADVKMKDLKINQREKRIDPLTLLKEDLFKVFKDKHTESELDERPLRQTGNLSTGSTPSLLKEVLSHLSKDKNVKSSDSNTSQTAEKSDNHLSLLKEDASNVIRTDCLKEKDTKENSSKMTDLTTERTNEPFKNLFVRDQKLVKTENVEDRKKEEPLDSGFRGNLTERDEENVYAETINNIMEQIDQSEDSKLDLKVSEEKSEIGFSEKQQSDEMMCTSNTSSPGGLFRKLLRRDKKALRTADKLQGTQEVSYVDTERKEEQLHSGFMGNITENNKPNNVKDRRNPPKHSETDRNLSDWTTFSETQQSEVTFTIKTDHPKGFPSSTTGFGPQKPTESKSTLLVEEHSGEKEYKESEIHLQEDDLTHKCDQKENKEKDVNVQDFPKTNQSEKRTTGTLTLLKEDFSHFKDDLFNVFRISLSKEEDNNQDSSQIEVQEVKDTKEPFKKEEQLDSDIKGRTDPPEDSELVLKFSEDELETSFSEVQQSEETMSMLTTGGDTTEDEKINVDEEDRPSEILSWDSSKISLLSLRYGNKGNMRGQAGGDLWSPKNFATYLTFDPNTANSELHLMEGNRTATRYWLGHRYLDHPERFQHCPQVLCREGLLDSVYWEVEWIGGADIGVAYNSISRDGDTSSCLLGHNECSWSLECSEGSYTPCYNRRRLKSSAPEPFTHRVGIYLDWSAGTLSFYCVSQDNMVPLHTFTTTFTEPLYAGFWIWAYKGSVSLRQVELDWERLQ
ncbi:enolase-phosphatase E1-like isoform X2 [Channa argus]|uniref:enolase-phosphatase E1-like isoform X2 n=1 Tax=Channa argus TaxID=215402 RepID=UPI0035201EBF